MWGKVVNRDFGALIVVHCICGFFGGLYVWVFIQTNIGELGVFSCYIRLTIGEGLDQSSQGLDWP